MMPATWQKQSSFASADFEQVSSKKSVDVESVIVARQTLAGHV